MVSMFIKEGLGVMIPAAVFHSIDCCVAIRSSAITLFDTKKTLNEEY